jgi:hypothetical protein
LDKSIRILEFAKCLFPDQDTAEDASEILQGIMEACSPRLSEIAAKMPGNQTACYKRIQRFLQEIDPQVMLKLLFTEEADLVIGDTTEIERPHASKTEYVGALMDGETKGFWMLTLATPLRGRAIPFHFLTYSSCTFEDQPSSRNLEHFKAIQENQQLIGTRPIVFDRGFSCRELIMTNMDPETGLALNDQRLKINICFRDLMSLLHIDKVMNKSQEYLNKMLAMVILAYAVFLVVGEVIRDLQYAGVVPDELNLL